MERIEGPGQAGFRTGDADVMDVIRHQTVGPDVDVEAAAVFGEPSEIALMIAGILEDAVAIIAVLEDKMGEPRRDQA